jgi:hypothetical protein
VAAQVWTLRRIGGIAVQELADWQGVAHQRIDHMLEAIDQVLENGLPYRRPNANPHRS